MARAVAGLALLAAAAGAVPASAAQPSGVNGLVAFASTRDGDQEIYTMAVGGSSLTRLTFDPGADRDPSWDEDSTRVAFASNRTGNFEIYSVNADRSGLIRLTSNPGIDDQPVWSPDGNRIAFTSTRDGNREIYVMGADGTGQTRLTDNDADDMDPAWSPDGRHIAFASNRAGSFDIYTMTANGTNVTRLTTVGFNGHPTWSPDGSKVAFASLRTTYSKIFVTNANGTGEVQVSFAAPVDDFRPSWSPDGSRIAFQSNDGGDFEIVTMKPDGTARASLTSFASSETDPSWGARPGLGPHVTVFTAQQSPTRQVDIRVVVLDSAGNVVSPTTVSLTVEGGIVSYSTQDTTDHTGMALFRLSGLNTALPGTYRVTATALGRIDVSFFRISLE